jgi:general secretion pathway protein A
VYLEYFGLTERPFSIAPDPHYLYMSARHKEAMAHLTYGLSQGGCFIVLTGEVGTGKTTLCRNLLGDLPDDVDVALILNANINEQELLQSVCDELKIAYRVSDSQKQLLDNLNTHLLAGFAENRQTVLIIDEAQLLSRDVLEQIRLLTNLETTKSKLLQIILIGQPELSDLLSRNDLRQLAQRVTARYHLDALDSDEIEGYVNFRLAVAGCRKPIFTRQALIQLHSSTEGIPRRINVLADHALLSAYSKTNAVVDSKSVKAATEQVFIQRSKPSSFMPMAIKWGAAGFALVLINVLLWWWFTNPSEQHVEQAPKAPSSMLGSDKLAATLDADANDSAAVSDISTIDKSAESSLAESNLTDALSLESVGSVSNENVLTTIVRSDEVTPGSVVIAELPLDEAELLVQQSFSISQPLARVFRYDPGSELGQALDASADLTGRIAAFRALGAAWDVDLPIQLIKPACDELEDNGIDCLGVTTWEQLTRYNRPAILVLDHYNSLHRVIVFKLDNDFAQVLVGQNVLNVSARELRSRWTNNGITFWRPSRIGSAFLQQGDTSNRLAPLRVAINQALLNINMPALDDLSLNSFDLSLAQAVFALQTRHSLLADSKIGSEIYLLLNELSLPEQTPVLRQRVK